MLQLLCIFIAILSGVNAEEVIGLIEAVQGTPMADILYYGFHVLGFLFVFLFNAWYGKKREISIGRSTVTTVIVYSVTYIWIYVLSWIESGFTHFGGNNIVRGFIYIPLIAYPVAKMLKISWKDMCDFIAPCVCLTQGISHIGCIFTGCCAGYTCQWGIYNQRYGGTAFPVQLFEAATALIIFAALVYWNKKQAYRTEGKSYPIMLMLFGSTRFLWEFARNNEKIWLGCSSLAFHALFMSVVGLVVYCVIKRKKVSSGKKKSFRKERECRR